MGLLVEGKWQDQWYDTQSTEGKFVREDSQFRHFITADGSSGFKAESGRYHLYISLACPWACRVLIFRKRKQLEEHIGLSVVAPYMGGNGWEFSPGPGCMMDEINHSHYLYEVYLQADPNYTGRVTVPVLWDKQKNTIVNNESAEIIRMLNTEFNAITGNELDFYPEVLRTEIDEINDFVYKKINNGVYKCGFATTQEEYEQAFHHLFAALDSIEQRLAKQRYLVGEQITEADWRLFTTLIRFDAVYYSHFKCNLRQIRNYPNVDNYLRELYQRPGIAETVNLDHIKQHYYGSHVAINPTGIVPVGPELDFNLPHNRG